MEEGVLRLCRIFQVDEDMLDNPYHTELNAHYYLQTGRVLAEDYALPSFDWTKYHAVRELDPRAARSAWEVHEEEKRRFFLSVAETLWDFAAFASRYGELISAEALEAYHAHCRKVFIEERVFLQPEWLLFSCAQWRGKANFLYQEPRVEFFCRSHGGELHLLPKCVLESKAFKEMLGKRYKIKWN